MAVDRYDHKRGKVEVRGCDLFEFSLDGKIKHKDSYWKIVLPKA